MHMDGVQAMRSAKKAKIDSALTSPRGTVFAVICACLLGVPIALSGGCQKTALRPDDNRSQFDRYNQSRNQRAQPFLEDEFGRRTPNLSERLLEAED